MAHPPAPPLAVPDADQRVLQAVVRATTSEQRTVTRARIVLRSADGGSIESIAMIDAFTRRWNDGSSPFTCRTADENLAKAVCKPRATSGSGR